MNQPTPDGWIVALVFILWLASISTWIVLLSRRSRHGAILDYEPRSPVPWGAPAALVTVLYVSLVFIAGVGEEAAQQAKEQNPSQVLGYLLGFIISQTLIVGVIVFIVAVLSGAKLRDLGMPSSIRELACDVRIGFIAFLAALAPVHAIQQLLFYVLGLDKESSSHPLIQMVSGDESNFTLLLLASVVAVVVAPLAEEILFRLLLQGWLEKWEDLWLGWRRLAHTNELTGDVVLEPILQPPNDAALLPVTIDETGPLTEPTPEIPPTSGIASLPFGWMPILFSSLLFAIAHYGHGPDPVALFVLALILGYVYQRTHRIVPTIVAHALFNAFAMVILWQMMLSDAE